MDTLLKPKRQMSEKQKEALKKGREKRHQLMRTNVPIVEELETEYTPVKETKFIPITNKNNDVDDDLNMMKEIKRKEHEMKMKELELKMSKLENDYGAPKKEEPVKEAPKFIFRNARMDRHFI